MRFSIPKKHENAIKERLNNHPASTTSKAPAGEKRFKNGLAIFIKGNNLLNTKRERYLKTTNEYNANIPGQPSDRTIVGTYRYGRTFLVGVRYTM